jgi:hypothetical protein
MQKFTAEQTSKSQAVFFRGSWSGPDAENYLSDSEEPAPPNYTRFKSCVWSVIRKACHKPMTACDMNCIGKWTKL